MRLTILTTLLFALVATPVLSEKEKKPKLVVKVRPRTQFIKPSDPFKEVRLEITIKDANEEWWCAAVGILWGDGSQSIIEPSCTYFEDADKSDIKKDPVPAEKSLPVSRRIHHFRSYR